MILQIKRRIQVELIIILDISLNLKPNLDDINKDQNLFDDGEEEGAKFFSSQDLEDEENENLLENENKKDFGKKLIT